LNTLQGWLWDDRVLGLGARKQTKGVFFYLRYRFQGRQIVKSIGRLGSPWTPELARKKALELLGTLVGGSDPFAQSLASEGFGAEVERYLERKRAVLKPRSFEEARRYLTKSAAPLHRRNLADIDRRAIALTLAEIERNSGPSSRNRARAALSAFFAWCIQEGLIDGANPVAGTGKAEEAGSRERVLTHDELRKLWRSLGDDTFSNIVRLLLLTACRRNEIGKLSWAEVDLVRWQINLPGSRVKNGRDHTVPLSSQAHAILAGLPRRNSSAFLFGERGFTDGGASKAKLDARLGIAPWRLHDLRRSAATYMAEIGVLPHVIEQALNHQSGHKGGIAGVYNRSKMTDAVRDGLQRWADHLEALTVGPPKQPVPTGLMERAFAVARGGKIVPNDDLANLTRHLKKPVTH
jgi:integrase